VVTNITVSAYFKQSLQLHREKQISDLAFLKVFLSSTEISDDLLLSHSPEFSPLPNYKYKSTIAHQNFVWLLLVIPSKFVVFHPCFLPPHLQSYNYNCTIHLLKLQRTFYNCRNWDQIHVKICPDNCRFTFTSFQLSCLDNAEYGPYRFTGTSIPPKQDIPHCTQVLVWFYSDDTVVQEGFILEYLTILDPGE